VDFDTTENLYIEGDNLEVLKLLQESYLRKIKMIYFDPPYNTGKDFVYKDNFTQNSEEYKQESGQVDENKLRLFQNPETSGRYHSDWLSMMYPRLKLARNLLTDDGVVLINIDEHEVINLNKIIEEIFGIENNLGSIIWDKRNPKGDSYGIASQHEYILCFSKNLETLLKSHVIERPKKNAKKILKVVSDIFKSESSLQEKNIKFTKWIKEQKDLSGGEKAYNKIDEYGNVYQSVSMAWPNNKKAPDDYFYQLIHPRTKKACVVPPKGWRNPSKTMKELLEKNLIIFGSDENVQPRRKYLLIENINENISSLLYYGGSDIDLLSKLGIPFDTPKVLNICKDHIQSFTKPNSIILDFFSGSATTAHAVMQLNAEELLTTNDTNKHEGNISENSWELVVKKGKRKFIMVQIPELTDEKSEAYKAGYKNICEIGKERIRRAGKKIKEGIVDSPNVEEEEDSEEDEPLIVTNKHEKNISENSSELVVKKEIQNLDIGFRVLRLDSSNLQDVYYKPQEYKQDELELFSDNVKPDRSPEDILFQILLDLGLSLSLPIQTKTILKKTVYCVAGNSLYACFDSGIDEAFAREIAKEKPLRIVFRDSGFKDDTAKTNVQQILKQLSPETEVRVF
jgi:adenine-specific DNA-methyltransferase